jgi:hypothetical protein
MNASICRKGSLQPVFCDFYGQMKIKPNGLSPRVIDFTFNLQLTKLRLNSQDEVVALVTELWHQGWATAVPWAAPTTWNNSSLSSCSRSPWVALILGEGHRCSCPQRVGWEPEPRQHVPSTLPHWRTRTTPPILPQTCPCETTASVLMLFVSVFWCWRSNSGPYSYSTAELQPPQLPPPNERVSAVRTGAVSVLSIVYIDKVSNTCSN